MKQLDRLLFAQGGDCFFCKKPLPKAEASVEHLFAPANGGPNSEDNCVACCKTLNALLGSRPLKEKIEVLLKQKGAFVCPASLVQQQSASLPVPAKVVSPPVPIAAKARKPLFTLAPEPNQRAEVPERASHQRVTCPTCKHYVKAVVGQVDFRCQSCGGAFRY